MKTRKSGLEINNLGPGKIIIKIDYHIQNDRVYFT